jgi:hypothetical protein
LSTVSRRGLLQATHEAAAFAGCIHSHTGLTLREHPIAFLRKDLAARSLVTCGEAMSARDGRWLMTGGLVLVRQMPGSAKGVMFLTIEDETGPANVVVWPKLRATPTRCARIKHDGDQRPHPAGRGRRAPHRPATVRSLGRPIRLGGS